MKKLMLLLSIILLAEFSTAFGQNDPGDPAAENTYMFNCRTYMADGYLLTATGRFTTAASKGVVEVAIQHPDNYQMPARLRFSVGLSSENVISKKYGGMPGYQILINEEAADISAKILFAKQLTDNSGEIFLNDESYEVYCTKEIDIY